MPMLNRGGRRKNILIAIQPPDFFVVLSLTLLSLSLSLLSLFFSLRVLSLSSPYVVRYTNDSTAGSIGANDSFLLALVDF